MTKKIFRSIFTAALAVLLAALVVIVGVLYGYFENTRSARLRSELSIAAEGVALGGVDFLKSFSQSDYRYTLISPNGTVIYDTEKNAAELENHSNRSEVKEALTYGVGESARFSSTLLEKTVYFAKKLPSGEVLRISSTEYSLITLILGIMQPIIIILAFALLLCAVSARNLAAKIVEPLESLDLENPLSNEVYSEISPLLVHIEQQNRKIRKQLDDINKNKSEFLAVINNMNEGLVLISESGVILAINNAAMQVFGTDSGCIGRDFLSIERSIEVLKAVNRAAETGKGEASLSRGGRVYRISVGRIGGENEKDGLAMLIVDETDRVFAERNRREFTANVAHELKTPIQSVMGSAELLKSGLVKETDVPKFLDNIHAQAQRLTTLIRDITELSRLDEKAKLPLERVDLYQAAAEVKSELSPLCENKNIDISLSGQTAYVMGTKSLAYELIFNLCDNAIKYNKPGGSVRISVEIGGGKTRLKVADTGIGIPPEETERVFERFYRVDKSRSKETGGTGLGLSIVRHAAEYMQAQISLESEVGKGTVIEVTFPSV